MKKKLSLLIIGGTGFFGKSILDSFKRGLLNKYNISKIIILARNAERIAIVYPELIIESVDFISGDISSISELPYADYVIHAATSTNMNDYINISNNTGKNNIEKSVANYCRIAHRFHFKSKILYCSSGAVYGKQPFNVEKIDENFTFQQDLSNLSIQKQNYCLGKRYAEKEIINLGKSGLSVSIARCFAFSGKYLPRNQHYAYGNFIGQAEKGETVTVNTNGIVYRSYLDADELVISLIKILQISSIDCPIYNVGSDESKKLHEIAEEIAIKYGVDCSYHITNNNIIDRYVPDTNKLKSLYKKETY